MARAFDAAEELARAVSASFDPSPATCEMEEIASRSWASVTFAGARHRLRLRLEGERSGDSADAFLAGLAEREFVLRGHILADILLLCDDRREGGTIRLTLEALTVEEC